MFMQEALFTDLVTRLRPRLISLARSILHDDEEAADAVQDALVSLWRMGDRTQEVTEAERLAMRITRNVSLNKQKHKSFVITALDNMPGDTVRPLTARQDNPHESMERQETERQVNNAIAALPKNQQAVILMHHMDGLSYQQIAAIQGSTESAVRMTASRAKANLINSLKQPKQEVS
jgi:RNA polymerase sigma-70 factor (ECF subfamily)